MLGGDVFNDLIYPGRISGFGNNRVLKEQKALLQSREQLLKIFVKIVPAGVAMLDCNMRYLQVSGSLVHLTPP